MQQQLKRCKILDVSYSVKEKEETATDIITIYGGEKLNKISECFFFLRWEEGVPVANLLAGSFSHLLPMFRLLVDGAVEPQGDPADQVPPLETPFVDDGHEQSHFGQLEQSHLEGESLQPGRPSI